MTAAKSSQLQTQVLEKKIIHPYALQCLSGSSFIFASNKILAGDFGIISFRRGRKECN